MGAHAVKKRGWSNFGGEIYHSHSKWPSCQEIQVKAAERQERHMKAA